MRIEGEILKFKSNDFFHYVIVPISFPDPLFFTSSSFAVFSFIAKLHRYIIFPYRIRENAKSVEGNLTGFDCYPGNGIHPNLDTGCRIFFFPICWEIETAQMYVVPCKANYIVAG